MGMDIHGRFRLGRTLHYNWNGWSALISYLDEWGVDITEFSEFNDGDIITAKTCHQVADALSEHWNDLPPADKDWLKGHAAAWRGIANVGGAEQW